MAGAVSTEALAAFAAVEMRVGQIVRAESHSAARKPAYRLWLDFGPLGTRTSSAQLTELYQPEELIGRLVIAVMNLGPRRVAGFASEVLVLGLPDSDHRVVLLAPERPVPLGSKVY